MKTLTVLLLVCAVMALTRGAALQEAPAEDLPVVIQDAPQEAPAEDVPVVIQLEESPAHRARYCPGGWATISGRCYLYNPNPKTWAKAQLDCQSQGGTLASVRNHDEDSMIQIFSGNRNAWLGAADAVEEGTWFWSDGSPFFYKREIVHQFDGGISQNCLSLNYGGSKLWYDIPCSWSLPYVCTINLS